VLAIAAQLDLVASLFTVVAAVLPVGTVGFDDALTGRVSTLECSGHIAPPSRNLRSCRGNHKLNGRAILVYNISRMGLWQRWLKQPQKVWLRRAIFQIHLWTGIALGLYIVMLSLSGSALVYRNELDRAFAAPRPQFDPDAKRLTQEELKAAAERAYPGYAITRVGDRISRRNPTVEVWAERGSEKKERLFNPYTGEDLGDAITRGERFVLWLARLHDELLFEREGRWWNGFLSGVFTLLVLTGFVVWWPGSGRWRRSLGVNWSAGWKRFNWDLHSALGIWLFLFMLMWGVSGFYLGMPEPFTDLVDWMSDPEALDERPGDIFLAWLSRIHFGRFRGNPWSAYLKATWAVVGIVPAIMFITGVIMWWNRVLRRKPRRELAETT
jgi:uncharacterized iron-regulated membrane protein